MLFYCEELSGHAAFWSFLSNEPFIEFVLHTYMVNTIQIINIVSFIFTVNGAKHVMDDAKVGY